MKKTLLYYTLLGVLIMMGSFASAQGPTVHSLSMDATSPDYSTNDDLTANYTVSATVETATAWYVNNVPLARLFYPFEADLPTALEDFSGRHLDLSLSGNVDSEPSWSASAGHNGTGAFVFDGNDYLDAGGVFPRNSSYTKAAWVYLTSEIGYRNIISGTQNADRNHGFKINPNGRANAGHSFGSYYVMDTDSLHNDVWYFLAVTFDFESGLMILYRDGVEVDRDIVPEANRSVADGDVLIGSKAYSFFMTGVIDDAMVFSRDLSPEQIQALYTDRGDLIVSKETRGGENWRVRVTPFSDTEEGGSRSTTNQLIQAPAITGLALSAETPASLTNEDLTVSFTENNSVTETATAWFRNGNPDALLYLPFEGIDEALNDYSGSNHHASMAGDMTHDPAWNATAGHNGSGTFVFDGNDYLMAGNIFPLNSSYTKTAWIYNSAGIPFGNIMSSDLHDVNNHTLRVSVDAHLTAGHDFGNATVRDPAEMAMNTWHFVAVTFDYTSGQMSLYRNGALVDQATVDPSFRDVIDPAVLIGSMNYLYNWTGRIDEPRLFNRVLSPQQINAMYTNDNVLVAEETVGGELWNAEVTAFSSTDAGTSPGSNEVLVHSVVVSDFADQTVAEGSTFGLIDLDTYVDVYEFTKDDLIWTSNGSSELIVAIDALTHVVTVTIPNVNWYGSENITFVATNPNGDADSTEVSYTVTNINDEPVLAVIGGQITPEDTPLTGLEVIYTDLDPTDSHTITVVSSNPNVVVANLTGNASGSTYDLVSAANWNGTSQITVTVTDNGSGPLFDSETYTLEVTAVNDAPIITVNGDESTNEDVNLTGILVVFTDPDVGDLHTITVASDNANVVMQNLSGHINGSHYDLALAADWNGSAEITVTVTDNGTGALTGTDTYTLTVNPVNDAPVLTEIGAQSAEENQTISDLAVVFTDPDATDTHVITVVSNDANVTVANLSGNTSGSTYDLIPAAAWNGSAEITVTVTDDGDGSLFDTETYIFTVNSVNDAPVITEIGDQSTDEEVSLTGLAVNFTDADAGDVHTITVVSSEANVTVANLSGNTSGSTYDLVPAADWNGNAMITVTVTDDGDGTLFDTESYTLTVNPLNDAPVLTEIGDQSTDEDLSLTGLAVNFTDVDAGDGHTITVVSSEANVTVANLSGNTSGSTYDLVPAAAWNGTAMITVTVTDDGDGTLFDTESYTLTVNPVNDAPVITEIGDQSTDEDLSLTGLSVNFTDADAGDGHTISVVSSDPDVTVASLSGNTSGSTYDLVPAADWNGTAMITVTVTDDGDGTLFDTESYTLTVNPVNDAPVSMLLSRDTIDEKVIVGTAVGLFSTMDIDVGDMHTYTLILDGGVFDVDNDAFTINGDTLKTNAEFDFEIQSSYSILVQSDDGQGGTIAQNFNITISDVDETSVGDIYNNPSFNVYPVPAIDYVTVEVDNPDNKEMQLNIYSNTGRLMHTEAIFHKNTVDLSGFTDGMYIIQIRGERVFGTRKIVVKDR